MSTSPTVLPQTSSTEDQNIQILELAISLFARNFKPTLLNLDSLKVSGIIPTDWELARQPVINNRTAQLSFKNGVSLLAQGNALTCAQAVQKTDELQIPATSRRFVEKMSNAEYSGVSISPKMLVVLGKSQDNEARKFIIERVIAPGPWREIGEGPAQAKVDFAYKLDRCPMTLSIAEAQLSRPNKSGIPSLLFASNFTYNLDPKNGDLLQQIYQRIDGWPQDLQMFQDIVQQRFLGQVDSVFPQ